MPTQKQRNTLEGPVFIVSDAHQNRVCRVPAGYAKADSPVIGSDFFGTRWVVLMMCPCTFAPRLHAPFVGSKAWCDDEVTYRYRGFYSHD